MTNCHLSVKPYNPAKECVKCLYSLGFGLSAINRKTGVAKPLAKKWAIRAGIYAPKSRTESANYKAILNKRQLVTKKPKRIVRSFIGIPEHEARKLRREYAAQWKLKNPEKVALQKAKTEQWRANNKDKVRGWNNAQSKKPENRIRNSVRGRIRNLIKGNKGKHKVHRTSERLGCTVHFFKKWLESQFEKGMSWSNYGKWHIDHIVPVSRFDLSKQSELLKCCHYTNMRPLWAKENMQKTDKIIECQPELLMSI